MRYLTSLVLLLALAVESIAATPNVIFAVDPNPPVVPEPATIVVWSILGLVGAGIAYRKRAKS